MTTHLILFILLIISIIGFFYWRIKISEKQNSSVGGYFKFDIITPIWTAGMIVTLVITILIYGGIYWW